MATHVTSKVNPGELRWITRLNSQLIPDGPPPSDLRENTGFVESKDVFAMADRTTRSKYYGDRASRGKDRAIDMTHCGATGPGIGVAMIYGSRESSSGGPFFRDIQNQCGSTQEIYNYMYSGHNQTEPWRLNVLHGPYALVFTDGKAPRLPMDFSWIEDSGLQLKGYVPASQRGSVSGKVSGIQDGFEKVVGFSNDSAQYWAKGEADGTYKCPRMKPGKYDVTLYQQELEVASDTVTVAAAENVTLDLAAKEAQPSFLWRIGDPDGTPNGFMNADKIIEMHPSDVRMDDWKVDPFVVGTSIPEKDFPCYQWLDINGTIEIQFELTKRQVVDSVVRVGITAAYSGARPEIHINDNDLRYPPPSSQPKSRSLTIGTYRGFNKTFGTSIAAKYLVAGTNKLRFNPLSGSGMGGFLCAGYSIDFVE